jgi:hypothetical protein
MSLRGGLRRFAPECGMNVKTALFVIACDKRWAFARGSVGDDPPSLAARAMARFESAEAARRVGGSNPEFVRLAGLRSLSSGAHSRDPFAFARNDGNRAQNKTGGW